MEIKADKQKAVRRMVAIALAAAMTFASATGAAAAPTENSNNITVAEKKLELELNNGDLLVSTNRNFDMTLKVVQACNITLDVCGKQQNVPLAKGTVSDVLAKADVEIGENQAVSPSFNTVIKDNMKIYVYDAKSIEITADGSTVKAKAPVGTVEDALNFLGYNVGKDDIVNTGRDAEVEDGMKVKLQRVAYKTEVTTEKIPYDTVEKETDDLETGKTKVTQNGVNGEQQVTKQCKYIDGKLVSSETVGKKTTKEAVDKVVLVGTKKGSFTDNSGKPVSYSYVLTGSGTAYTSPSGARTATGVPAYEGGVAVNPNIIPYGSKLYIEAADGSWVYGYATAVDTGGALMEGSALVDLYYNSYSDCITFGRRTVNIYVL